MRSAWLLLFLLACSRHSETGAKTADPGSAPNPVATGSPTTPVPAPQTPAAATPPSSTTSQPSPSPPPEPETPLTAGGKKVVQGKFGLVTSVEDQATKVGVAILEQGGNAVDAAVAVGFALAVTHPSAGNIGGGGFLLVRFGGETAALDFREVAPRLLTRPDFDAMIGRKAKDGAAVGVPGSVAGLFAAHERYGRLPWKSVVLPAARLAKDGYLLGKRQAQTLRWAWRDLKKDPVAKAAFGNPQNGLPAGAGTRIRRPRLAVALERIADSGAKGFYEGPTASDLVAAVQPHGSMTEKDLADYEARWREPLRFVYRGYEVETMPPPSAGGVALTQTLLMLQELEVWKEQQGSAASLHLLAEAARRAHAERRFRVSDPDLLSEEARSEDRKRWLDAHRALVSHPIDRARATPSADIDPLYATAKKELENTTHFSVVDGAGGIVSCTMTLSASFGAKRFSRETGIVLNNSVASFSSAGENQPAGGKRTVSSMAPTLVLSRGRPVAALGTPGGDTIPNTVAQVLMNLVDHGMPLDEAIDAPRIHHGLAPDEIGYETLRPPPPAVRARLRALGHRVVGSRATIGDANDLLLIDGTAYGYADPREGGLAEAAAPPSEDKESVEVAR